MSELRVASINNPSAGSGGLAISAAGNVTGAGLDLIVTESFSAVASISLDNVFTGDYDNYRVSVLATGSASTDTALRLRASGTDTSTGYNYMYNYSSRTTGLNRTRIGRVNGAPACLFAIDIYAPFIATATIGQSENVNGSSTVSAEAYGWQQTGSTSFDGFTIYPESGTFTGTVSVYGYKS